MTDDTNDFCEECKFWLRVQDDLGLCRRHAPRPLQKGEITEQQDDVDIFGNMSWARKARPMTVLFPVTEQADWCGEFEASE